MIGSRDWGVGVDVAVEAADRIGAAPGACAGLTELFFSEWHDDAERAIDICRTCAVQAPCLQIALARREPHGVWGGRVFRDGVPLDAPPKRGRPAKAA